MSDKEERIIQMQFDNKQFEAGAQESIKTLDKLKSSLKLEESARSLANLERAGKNFSLAGMANGIDTLVNRFSNLGIVGITIIQNITNSAIRAGERIVSALTIDPVKSGLDEYETKMNAIQTILTNTQSKGTTLDDVNAALAELNTYADQTIYNFAEMTRNIGTFTAAGIDLKTSTEAIKGIANLAAGSGSSAQQASTAMYQLSQALAAGKVQLMDWNSVVNAGMGGELFQKALEKTAAELGNARDMTKSFRDSIQDGWITTEVLTKTLQKFANDPSLIKAATQVKTFTQLFDTMKESVQSGWAVSWENIIGNKDQAAATLTAINDAFSSVVGASADARNEMLAFWNANGGRTALIEGISNALIGLSTILEPIETAFRDIFPPITGERLVTLTKGFRDLMAGFKIGEGTAENLRRTFKGIFAVVDIGIKTFGFIAKAIGLVFKALAPGAGGLLSITGSIGDFFVALNNAIEKNKIFGIALEKLGVGMTFVRDIISSVVSVMSGAFSKAGEMVLPYILGIKDAIKNSTIFSDTIEGIKQGLITFGDGVKNTFDKIKTSISSFTGTNFGGATVVTTKFGKALDGLSESGSKVKDSLGWVGIAVDNVKDALQKAWEVVSKLFSPAIDMLGQKLKDMKISDIGSILAGGGVFMIAKTLKNSLGSVQDISDGFANVINSVSGVLESFQTKIKAEAIFKIALSIGVLAISVIALSMIDRGALQQAIIALTAVFTELAVSFVILQKASSATPGLTTKLLAIGASVLLVAIAMKKLSDIDNGKIMTGVEGLAAVLTLLALFTKVTSGTGSFQGSMTGLIGLSVGILILSSAINKFGSMDIKKMQQGIEGLSASLMGLALFVKLVGNPSRMVSMGVGIAAIGVAMNLFAGAIALFGLIPVDNLIKGVSAMAASLMSIALAMKLMPKPTVMLAGSVAMNIMSVALYAVAGAIAILGNMSLESLVKGIGSLGAALLVMAATMNLMKGGLAGAAALLVMAGAIVILTPAIALLGALSLQSIGVALLALAGVFGVLGLSALILTPLAPVIMLLAASIAVLSVGVYAIGAGLVAFAAGLAAIAAGGAVFIGAITAMGIAILNLIPLLAKKLGEGVGSFARAIVDNMPDIMAAIKSLTGGLIQAFTELIPPVVDAAVKFMLSLLKKLAEYIQPMVDAGLKLVIGLLKGIADNIQQVVEVAIDVIIGFLKGVTNKLPDIIKAGVDLVVALITGIGNSIGKLIEAGFQLVVDFINGLADAVREKTPLIMDAVFNLGSAIIEGIGKGLWAGLENVVKIIGDVGKAIINGFKDLLGINSPSTVFTDFGKYIIEGLINGIKNFASNAIESVKNLGKSILSTAMNVLGIHSPSKLFKEMGENLVAGMSNGIDGNSDKAVTSAENMSTDVANASSTVVEKSNEASKEAFDKAAKWIDDRKYYNKLSLEEELKAWQDIQKDYAKGTEERDKADKEVYRVKKEIRQKDYDDAVDKINDLKYYNKLTLDQELKYWQDIQKKYKKGMDEREEADKEVYRIQNEIKDDNYNKEVKRIDNLKYYNRLSLSQELQAWLVIQAKYKEGTEERESADREVYRVKKEITDKLTELDNDYYTNSQDLINKSLSDIKDLNDAYDQAVKDRSNAIYSSYGLFDKLESPEYVSGHELISNLEGQVSALEDWSKQVNALASKGISDGLLKELEAIGPSALAQVRALNTLNPEELNKYVSLWAEKHNEATKQAFTELEGLKEETTLKINEINAQTQTDLEALNTTWKEKTAEITGNVSGELDKLGTAFDTKTDTIVKETNDKFVGMAKSIKNINWSGVGVSIIDGIKSGIMSQAESLSQTTTRVALQALNSTKKALGIHSPSKEFEKVGMYSGEGMIIGLENLSGSVAESAKNVGNSALLAISGSVSRISDIINGNIDSSPTIRPVVDLSNIKSSNNLIDSIFGNGTSRTVGLAGRIIQNGSNSSISNTPSGSETGSGTISNMFNIPSLVVREEADIKKIARELYNLQLAGSRG